MSSPSDDSQPRVISPDDHGQSVPEMSEALRESFARQAEHTRELQEALKKQTDAMKALEQKVQTLDKSHADEVNALKQKMDGLLQSSSTPGPSTQSKPSAAPPPRRGRNLVVCIDGTSNQFSIKNTNVVELYHRLIKDNTQLTYYNSGIGTYAAPSWKSLKYYRQVLDNKVDLAIAWNYDDILLGAYRWLAENYEDGDVIFLFGFSRGAYQIRTLAAMIESVGLIHKGNLGQIAFAYELYAQTKKLSDKAQAKGTKARQDAASPTPQAPDASAAAKHPSQMNKEELHKEMCRRFKVTFSRKDVIVHFAGAWDTVSSVGLVRDKTLPGTTDGMQCVTYFRHALALHERRVKFLHENVRGGLGPTLEATQPGKDGRPPHTKEVWFAGSHGDIGGGAKDNLALDQFGPALRWMLFEATLAGLRLTDTPQQWEENPEIHNTLRGVWRLFEYLPFTRLSYEDENQVTSRPHLGRPRQIQENQLIHETALEYQPDSYPQYAETCRWRAQLPKGREWDKDDLNWRRLVEADPYTTAGRYIAKIADAQFSVLSASDIAGLRALVEKDAGQASMRDISSAKWTLHCGLLKVLRGSIEREDGRLTIDVLLLAMERCDFIDEDSVLPQARAYAANIARTDENLARRFITLCGSAMVGNPIEHPDDANSVVYMPDGDRLVSGGVDRAVRVWDLKTGEIVGDPMTGHTDWVTSVAVSADGMRIASGSEDNTIRVWSVETGTTIALLEGHRYMVFSVAFSPDGSRVVSGSSDETIRVWDVATAKTVVGPIQGHLNWISSVAYSPDGSRIVSAADGGSVRLWNAETGEQLWQAVMSSDVSVAYSPDGKRIVAGCWDRTVHVLEAATGRIVLGSLTGHTASVRSVAFSPDGKRIASGSIDRTIRLWDAETGAALDVLRGHRDTVQSVAFSPDGTRVASASRDKTVRVWDATGEWKRW